MQSQARRFRRCFFSGAEGLADEEGSRACRRYFHAPAVNLSVNCLHDAIVLIVETSGLIQARKVVISWLFMCECSFPFACVENGFGNI